MGKEYFEKNPTLFKKVEIQRPTDPTERLAYELRLREIRDDLRKIDPLERDAIYAGSTDPMVLDAIETSPPVLAKAGDEFRRFVPPIDRECVAAVKIARAHAVDPENAKLDDRERRFGIAVPANPPRGLGRVQMSRTLGARP